MDISVLIPTRGRPDKLSRCLTRLGHQGFPHNRFEVLVGVDGGEGPAADAAQALAETTAGSIRATIHQFEHAGPAATRNRLLERARGRLILMLNDDVLPEPDLLSRHAAAHDEWARSGTGASGVPAMVLGFSPWTVPGTGAEDTLFDRLVRETSMIFFYDRMQEGMRSGRIERHHDWGYRHAWTLNLSLPRRTCEAVGGFDQRLTRACYEDLEFAYRVWKSTGAPVLYEPRAVAEHDHRIRPEDYLRREYMMGGAAWAFAEASPQCAIDVFGRDIRTAAEVEYSRQFVDRERTAADRLRETFAGWSKLSAASIEGPSAAAIIKAMYEHHLLLKRWTWRSGLVEAANERDAVIPA